MPTQTIINVDHNGEGIIRERDIAAIPIISSSEKIQNNSSISGNVLDSLGPLVLPSSEQQRPKYRKELILSDISTNALSASNMHAYKQGNLSLRLATPPRSYNDPRSHTASAKMEFELKVRAYYHQLTVGCGAIRKCHNKFCFSCLKGAKLQPDLAAIMAIQLASRTKTFFCVGTFPTSDVPYISPTIFEQCPAAPNEPPPARPFLHAVFMGSPFQSLFGPRTQSDFRLTRVLSGTSLSRLPVTVGTLKDTLECELNIDSPNIGVIAPFDKGLSHPITEQHTMDVTVPANAKGPNNVGEGLSLTFITKDLLQDAIDVYHLTKDSAFLVNTIRTVFSSSEALNQSFRNSPTSLSTADDSGLDTNSVQETYQMILSLEPLDIFQTNLVNALEILIAHLANTSIPASGLAQLMIILEFPPLVSNPSYLETMVKGLSRVISELPESSAKRLRQWWSRYAQGDFIRKVMIFQQYVSVHHHPNIRPDSQMIHALNALQLLYEANELADKQFEERVVDTTHFYNDNVCRKIDFKEEYNLWKKLHGEGLSKDTEQRQSLQPKVSLFDYPFLFDPASKSRILHIDAIVQMSQVFEEAFVRSAWVFQAQKILEESSRTVDMKGELKSATCPYLVLEVRRAHLMQDTLAQLTTRKTMDLKKPLKIKYVGGGEEGLDMGGVQKEFFQMIVEHIFNVEVGMFVYSEETRQCWINGFSMESQKEFELVGLLLGLAIYNGVILDVHLPLVLYKKLLGHEPTLADLKVAQPRVGKSLQQLIDWDPSEGDVESTFCYTFQITESLYGQMRTINLKPDGGSFPVTNDNRGEFVRLYVDYLLNCAVQRQFTAFSRGFHRVCGGPALSLCTPDELELLICGSPHLDFQALEQAATYDDGYSADHPLMKEFWKIVHSLDQDQRKQLLNFVTGSDRVPIAGLSNMAFVVQRNGPDSHRLPTALTCFSRLLMPEYSSGEKMKEKLLLAMENGRGFGLV